MQNWGGAANLSYPDSKLRRGRVIDGGLITPTLMTSSEGIYIMEDQYMIRKLTPKECWRLMGFSDEQFQRAKDAGLSDTQLYKQAGNSITTCTLYYIYKNLYKAMPYLFDNLKLGSFFSGIGAFENALDKFYADINSQA